MQQFCKIIPYSVLGLKKQPLFNLKINLHFTKQVCTDT